MLLRNLNVPGEKDLKDVLIAHGKIQICSPLNSPDTGERPHSFLQFKQAVIFPGLVNSHDHLDFNLFPQLGNKIYKNYIQWGLDIHEQYKEEIRQVLRIPLELRVQWGIYKNLLNGITTVVNHGLPVEAGHELIFVFQRARSLHSPAFEKKWKWQLNRPYRGDLPFVMHIGEGTDGLSHQEIDTVIRWNFFKRKVIGIHGVAMDPEQAKAFRALIWCPASNFFLQQQTARIDRLKKNVAILFGSDSTLTAGWNFWDHIRLARGTGYLTDQELIDALTSVPSTVWGLTNTGKIQNGQWADIVIADMPAGMQRMDALYATNPENILMVCRRGEVLLFDDSLYASLAKSGLNVRGYHPVKFTRHIKYLRGDLPRLIRKIKEYHPGALFPVTTD
jgi:cytosine/adenosine deaminase-related metal-dependent hydrolase